MGGRLSMNSGWHEQHRLSKHMLGFPNQLVEQIIPGVDRRNMLDGSLLAYIDRIHTLLASLWSGGREDLPLFLPCAFSLVSCFVNVAEPVQRIDKSCNPLSGSSVRWSEVWQLGVPVIAVNLAILRSIDVGFVKLALLASHREPAIIEGVQHAVHLLTVRVHQNENVQVFAFVDTLLSSSEPFVRILLAGQAQAESRKHRPMLFSRTARENHVIKPCISIGRKAVDDSTFCVAICTLSLGVPSCVTAALSVNDGGWVRGCCLRHAVFPFVWA